MRKVVLHVLVIFVLSAVHAGSAGSSTDRPAVKPPQAESAPQKKFTNMIGQTFVYLEPGSFMMGSPVDEIGRSHDEAQHPVTLSRGFYMQTTEVTQGQWQAIMEENPSYAQECGAVCPVESVSWDDVQNFLSILNQRPGSHSYRLPTEAEWEYAARAGTKGTVTGHSLDALAWHLDNSGKRTRPVGMKNSNSAALYDMLGNVSEWVQDWYGDYPEGSVIDPAGPPGGYYRVNRGGGWDMPAFGCRFAQRNINSPGSTYPTLGFRLVAEERIVKYQ